MTYVDENKYIVFKRDDFDELTKEHLVGLYLLKKELTDAVVIRRQDKFASPCLLTYAAMIGMVAEYYPKKEKRIELQKIADYFYQQGTLAGEEGCHLPTL